MAVINFESRADLYPLSGKDLHYAVYTAQELTPNGHQFTRSYIVLKDEYKNIVRFTRLEEYAGTYAGKAFAPVYSDAEQKCLYVTQMLNYILVGRGELYGVDHVFGITKAMMADFFNHYALSPKADGTTVGRETVEKCIRACTAFMYGLWKKHGREMAVQAGELYHQVSVRGRGGATVTQSVPDFQARGQDDGSHPLLRDIPVDGLSLLISLAYRHDPGIAFPIVVQCTAGLRPGEVVNMRRADSPGGPGLSLTRIGGKTTRVEIDISRRLPLRSDGVVTGGIKRPRRQCVYTPLIPLFEKAYGLHMGRAGDRYEKEYAPMFVNQNGMAMTYENYSDRLQALVRDHFRPALLESDVPELRLYGTLLAENRFPPHGFRHFFSTLLAMNGESTANIQYWRGDRNPESALWYLQNKGDLLKAMRLTNDRLASLILAFGEGGGR